METRAGGSRESLSHFHIHINEGHTDKDGNQTTNVFIYSTSWSVDLASIHMNDKVKKKKKKLKG